MTRSEAVAVTAHPYLMTALERARITLKMIESGAHITLRQRKMIRVTLDEIEAVQRLDDYRAPPPDGIPALPPMEATHAA